LRNTNSVLLSNAKGHAATFSAGQVVVLDMLVDGVSENANPA
jgi:hypothetical protein